MCARSDHALASCAQPLNASQIVNDLPLFLPMCNGAAYWTLACVNDKPLPVSTLFQFS